jgi:hypothetical protein
MSLVFLLSLQGVFVLVLEHLTQVLDVDLGIDVVVVVGVTHDTLLPDGHAVREQEPMEQGEPPAGDGVQAREAFGHTSSFP